jgi:hypothetical protein
LKGEKNKRSEHFCDYIPPRGTTIKVWNSYSSTFTSDEVIEAEFTPSLKVFIEKIKKAFEFESIPFCFWTENTRNKLLFDVLIKQPGTDKTMRLSCSADISDKHPTKKIKRRIKGDNNGRSTKRSIRRRQKIHKAK